MSQKTAFHLTAGVCFIIALVLYVMGFAAPGNNATVVFVLLGGFFEFLAWRQVVRFWRASKAD